MPISTQMGTDGRQASKEQSQMQTDQLDNLSCIWNTHLTVQEAYIDIIAHKYPWDAAGEPVLPRMSLH